MFKIVKGPQYAGLFGSFPNLSDFWMGNDSQSQSTRLSLILIKAAISVLARGSTYATEHHPPRARGRWMCGSGPL
ncbi:hypothetical protein BFP70_13615 [Thioclava sp. SK-1]|nr:hypothetical protein BFP70_13615 [Thioclava sp. SK-1]